MPDTPEAYYRNALDLNRFGNGVQDQLRRSYNRIIVDSVEKLARINELPLETRPKYKAARLRALLKQTTESLARWSGKSEKTVIKELQGLAKVQVDFAVNQLEAALPAGIKTSVNSVEVSASYAESVVTKKATDLNASLLSDDLEAKVKGVPQKFSLTAKKGSQITLPNGEVLTKAFRGLAAKQADLFGRNVRDGLLSGETTQQMTRRLYGILKFEGGAKMTNNQISTLVKTSVQSVSNQAAQTVYEANQDISKEYRWIATLDSRTAPECRILDQTTHKYGQGPEPPQHFGCRCRTTAVLDYKALGVDPPKYKYVKRSGEGGSVPIGTSYGKWLSQQSASYKAEALGQSKVKYFNALSKKYGPDQALKKLVREDGSAKTLKQLQKTYTKTPSKKLAPKPKVKPVKPLKQETLEAKLAEIKSNEQYLKEAKENELKLKNLKSDFKKKTTKRIHNNDYAYVGEDFVKDEWVDIGNKRIKEMGYKIDNVMLDKTKLKGWSSEWEKLDDQIGNWKGGATSTQAAQCYNLQKSGAKNLSSYAKSRARRGANLSPQSLKALTKQANDLEEFVSRAPTYDGKIMRGMKIPKKDFNNFIDDLAKGKATVNLESWSADLDIAEDFAGLARKNGKLNVQTGYARSFDDVHVITTVNKNKYGASIRNLADDYQSENEVLIPSGIRYRLVDLKVTPIGTKGHEAWEVVLEQL